MAIQDACDTFMATSFEWKKSAMSDSQRVTALYSGKSCKQSIIPCTDFVRIRIASSTGHSLGIPRKGRGIAAKHKG